MAAEARRFNNYYANGESKAHFESLLLGQHAGVGGCVGRHTCNEGNAHVKTCVKTDYTKD